MQKLFAAILFSAMIVSATSLSCNVGEREAFESKPGFDYCKSVFYKHGYEVTLSGMYGMPPDDEMPIRSDECVLTKNKNKEIIITCLCFDNDCNHSMTFDQALAEGSSFRFNAEIEI